MDPRRRYRATLWLFVLTATSLAQQPERTAVFAGTVRDALTGQPLAHAAVRLLPKSNGDGYQAITDASGAFHFNALPALQYRFETARTGYEDSHLAILKEGDSSVSIVQLAAGQSVADARIVLQPEGAISGRVTDADGAPMAASPVNAIGIRWDRGQRHYEVFASGVTDAAGNYRLRAASGRYYIQAVGPRSNGPVPGIFATEPGGPEMKLATIYYPAAKEIEAGATVEIHPGQQLSGIDFKLPLAPCYHVRGVVRSTQSQPGAGLMLLSRNAGWSLLTSSGGGSVRPDGSFDIPGVLPGHYSLQFFPPGRNPGGLAIDITDRDINGVQLAAMPRLDVKGAVRVDGPAPEPPAFVEFRSIDPALFDTGDRTTPKNGAFSFRGLPPRRFAVLTNPGFYVESVSADGRELPGGIVDLTHGVPGEIEIVVGQAAGQIEGSLHLSGDAAFPEATAVLVSADGQTGNTGARSAAIDPGGRFRFSPVPPGRWYVFAVPHFEEGLWQNMEFVSAMSAQGAAVTVSGNTGAPVEVSLVSMDDLNRAAGGVAR